MSRCMDSLLGMPIPGAATLKAMLERGELLGQSYTPKVHHLTVGDEVELRVEMPTDIEGETRYEWVNKRSTIVKIED